MSRPQLVLVGMRANCNGSSLFAKLCVPTPGAPPSTSGQTGAKKGGAPFNPAVAVADAVKLGLPAVRAQVSAGPAGPVAAPQQRLGFGAHPFDVAPETPASVPAVFVIGVLLDRLAVELGERGLDVGQVRLVFKAVCLNTVRVNHSKMARLFS